MAYWFYKFWPDHKGEKLYGNVFFTTRFLCYFLYCPRSVNEVIPPIQVFRKSSVNQCDIKYLNCKLQVKSTGTGVKGKLFT